MREQITQRIVELGGVVHLPHSLSLLEFVQSIEFPHPIYAIASDRDMYKYRVHHFYTEHKNLYQSDRQTFFDNLLTQHFSADEAPRGQSFWRGSHFTPFTEGTADFKEWSFDFNEDSDHIDISPIREIVGDGELQFVQLTYVYGYPDHFYICLQDPDPENPTVFGTDHETFFLEIRAHGRLLDFFQQHYTQTEFRADAIEYLKDEDG